MRPGQQNKQRMRGRGRKGPNPLSRSYESNGPDVKIRGTAQHIAEKYSTLARDAAASGDRVMAENYLQHAEHYGRIVAAAQGSFQLQQDENDFGDQMDDEGDEDGGNDLGYSNGQNGNGQNQNGTGNGQNGNGQPYAQDRQTDRGSYDRNQGDRNQGGQPQQMRDGNRDGNRQRDNNGNRENNRDVNRDGNREARDASRDNRGNGSRENVVRDNVSRENVNRDNREHYQNRDARDNRGNRERPAPNGLGPQPSLPDNRADNRPVMEAPRAEPQREPVEMAREQQPVTGDVPREEFRARVDEQAVDREPRRRGRPRRTRLQDGVVEVNGPADASAQPEPVEARTVAPAIQPPVVQAEMPVSKPVAETVRPEVAADAAPEGEVKVKRKPGRPRKKKPEDDGGDEGGDGHLPAFLMASSG